MVSVFSNRPAVASPRGKLTVFFGAAPGVGKTYAMLEAARTERDLKRDVAVGIVETHGRYETGALVIGLELLPRRNAERSGATFGELDLAAALSRKPGLLLVDELSHRNAAGAHHARRWQDVEDLLDAGIDVYTTLNVQHLESLNDVVAQITGVVVKDTVPDRIFDQADDVRIIDLPIDELRERAGTSGEESDGGAPDGSAPSCDGFFRTGNLIALRELALRRTAERVDAQMNVYREAHGIDKAWPVAERIVVCISPSPASAKLVRAAHRMAARLRAEWVAVYVETPAALRLNAAARARVRDHLRLAESLGGETVTLDGTSAAADMVSYARARNATKIVLGKPTHPRGRDLFRTSFLEEVVRRSSDIDVYVISGEAAAQAEPRSRRDEAKPGEARGLAFAPFSVLASTALAWSLFTRAQLPDVVMVYLLGIVFVAIRASFSASILAAVLSVLAIDFVFIPPYLSLNVSDYSHVVTFAVMFLVAVVISTLMRRIRAQAGSARRRERRTARLYAMTRDLASMQDVAKLADVAVRHLHDVFRARAQVFLPDSEGRLEPRCREGGFDVEANDRGVASWVWAHGKPAGLMTDTLPSAKALFVPLEASHARVGVLGLKPNASSDRLDSDERQLLATFATQIAASIDRARLAEEAQRARLSAETEQMRSSLLSSVSHDLRTPLGVITGASSALRSGASLSEVARRELVETIDDEALHLSRLVSNLLDMTRLASGALAVRKEWHPLDEIVGVVLGRLDARLEDRAVTVDLPSDLPPVPMDAVLIEQVLMNLLENALKYTPPGTPLGIAARALEARVVVEVSDRGPGVPVTEREAIFEKFYRVRKGGAAGGAGLGLAICRGMIAAHGGQIAALENAGGGALFRFTLPADRALPADADEQEDEESA